MEISFSRAKHFFEGPVGSKYRKGCCKSLDRLSEPQPIVESFVGAFEATASRLDAVK